MKFIYSADRKSLVNADYIRCVYIREIPAVTAGSNTHAIVAELACGENSRSVVMLRGTSTKCTRALDTFFQAMNVNAPYPELDDEWIDSRK